MYNLYKKQAFLRDFREFFISIRKILSERQKKSQKIAIFQEGWAAFWSWKEDSARKFAAACRKKK